MPDLSVSIVNTNSRELLLACLDSLAGTDAEIVVLDNASEDGSAEAVRDRFPEVRVIAQPYRAGFGANHNTVIRATTGRYVYVLNEDTTAGDWGFERTDRISRRSSARGSARSEDRLSRWSPAGFGVAVPDAAREHRFACHSRPARRDAVARRASRAPWTG